MSQTLKGHFRLLAEVRWQVFRNELRRKRKKYELAAKIAMATLGVLVGLGMGLLLGAIAYLTAAKGQTRGLLGLLWLLFVAWQLVPLLTEASSPALNFREIARYPVSFRLYYLLSTAYGLLDPVALLCLGWLGCIWVGMALARPQWALSAAVLFLTFALLNLLLNRMLFGSLERVMSTRRGRERLLVVALVFLLLIQVTIVVLAPRAAKGGLRAWGPALAKIERVSPPGLVSRGVAGVGLADGLTAVLGLGAYAAAAALLLRRQLWRNYRGEVLGETPPLRHAVQVQPGWKLPWLDQATSAIVEKELRYAWSSPIVVMNFLSPLLMAAFTVLLSAVASKALEEGLRMPPGSAYPVMTYFALMSVGEVGYNCFGADARGFYRWLMAPVDLRRVYRAKNLALGGMLAANFAAVTLLVSVGPGVSPTEVLVVGAGFLYASLATLGAGNLLSAWFPVGVEHQRMSGRKVSEMAALLRLLVSLAIIGTLALVFYLARRWNLDRLPLVAFGVLILTALRFYLFSLDAASEHARHHAEEIAEALA